MTQPNKYIHHTLWREADMDNKWLYIVKQMTTNYTHLSQYSWEQLIALWFQPVEEEPKQELIPLDMEKIIDEIIPCFDWQAVRYYQLREVLSKYGTTPQKKRTEQEIRNMYYYTSSQNNDYNINDTLAPWIIITFLRKVWLLQE